MRRSDHPGAQPFHADDARHAADHLAGLFGDAFGGLIEQGLDGGAAEPDAEQRDQHGHRDGGGGVTPGEAEQRQTEPDDDCY